MTEIAKLDKGERYYHRTDDSLPDSQRGSRISRRHKSITIWRNENEEAFFGAITVDLHMIM